MSLIDVAVLAVLIYCGYRGYRRGFLRVVYSLFGWMIVLGIVSWCTPYLTQYLIENTALESYFQQKCEDYLEKTASEKLEDYKTETQADTGTGTETEAPAADSSGTSDGVRLPESFTRQLTGELADSAGTILAESGMYSELAAAIAHFIIEGISFFISFLLSGFLMRAVGRMVNRISRLPVIHGADKSLGMAAGVCKGLLIIWLALYILALCAASDAGEQVLGYVKQSRFLLYLYDNNMILELLMYFHYN